MADLASAAQEQPTLRAQAMAFQHAFAEGTRRGMADYLSDQILSSRQRTQFLKEQEAPTQFKEHESTWRRGFYRGYSDALQMAQQLTSPHLPLSPE
jgi:hypothetical protein